MPYTPVSIRGHCFFFIFACLNGVKWYLVVLICIFLVTVEVQHTHIPLSPVSFLCTRADFFSPDTNIRGCCLSLFLSIKIWAVQPDN